MKISARTLISIGACITAVGCVGLSLGGDRIRWTEEVKLSDGNVIQIQRQVELTESGFPIQNRGFDKYHELCYPPMGIHWKSKSAYQPDIFDIVDGKAYMHVPVASQVQCYEQGSPATGAIYFRWDNDHWTRIPPEEFPERSEWNLLGSIKAAHGHEKDDPKGLITLESKGLRDQSMRLEQKRFGWKRVNESYAWRDGCKPWSKGLSTAPKDIFLNDGKSICRP